MRYILFIAVLLLLSGCSNKKEFQTLINNDSIYTHAIAYTKKATLKKQNQTAVMLTAIYLNPLYKQSFNDAEYFFIGLHVDEDDNTLNNYTLTMNEQEALKIAKADKNDFKNLPLLNEWTTYYLVKFATSQNDTMQLRFGNEALGYENFSVVK